MSDSRRHHVIPLMLQRRFADANGHVFLFDKRRPNQDPVPVNPINAFVKTDLNAIKHRDGSRDTALEQYYSRMESDITFVIDDIIRILGVGELPVMPPDTHHAWNTFICHQQKRPVDAYARLGLTNNFAETVAEGLTRYEAEYGPIPSAERAAMLSENELKRLMHNVSVQARGEGGEEIVAALDNRGLAYGVISDPSAEFVLGDHPLARMGGTDDLRDPATELWLPISPHIAVTPWGRKGAAHRQDLTAAMVHKLNALVFRNSNVIAARSPAHLAPLRQLSS